MSQSLFDALRSGRLPGDGVERVARHMFERQAVSYGADGALMELAWSDADIRRFWLEEAASVIGYIERLSGSPPTVPHGHGT